MIDVSYYQRVRDNFVISTDPALLDRAIVFQFLLEAKWWANLNLDSLSCALQNSLCFSLLEDGHQIGMARVITDYVTYAYLCDVFIAEERRRRGLGTWLIRCILDHPQLKDLKRIALITHDAQPFYLKMNFGFPLLPECYMERT